MVLKQTFLDWFDFEVSSAAFSDFVTAASSRFNSAPWLLYINLLEAVAYLTAFGCYSLFITFRKTCGCLSLRNFPVDKYE